VTVVRSAPESSYVPSSLSSFSLDRHSSLRFCLNALVPRNLAHPDSLANSAGDAGSRVQLLGESFVRS
jgi:hypothetical protein